MPRRIATLLITSIAILALAPAALADGPVITDGTLSVSNVPWGPSCGAEPLMVSFAVARRTESFFDDALLVRQSRHVTGHGLVWLASTGRSLPYDINFTSTTDVAARTTTITGQWAHVLVSGSGVVFKNSGRIVQDISHLPPTILDEAGSHDYFDAGGVERLCAALGA